MIATAYNQMDSGETWRMFRTISLAALGSGMVMMTRQAPLIPIWLMASLLVASTMCTSSPSRANSACYCQQDNQVPVCKELTDRKNPGNQNLKKDIKCCGQATGGSQCFKYVESNIFDISAMPRRVTGKTRGTTAASWVNRMARAFRP